MELWGEDGYAPLFQPIYFLAELSSNCIKAMTMNRPKTATRMSDILRNVGLRVAVFLSLLLVYFVPTVAQIDAEMVTNMGRNALSVDDYLTAIQYFNQAIESKPYLSSPYYYRAYAKFTLEDYLGAEADCDKSIELNPFIVEVYQLRGLCRIHSDNFQGAIDDYSHVLRDLPNDQGSRYNRALCYLQMKDYARSDSDLNMMLQKWPNYTRTYMVKAQSLLEQKDTVKAIDWIDQLLKKAPRESSAWSFKGRYELSKQNYKAADTCLTKAITLTPNDFELYIARAQARHALGRFGLAIADYDRTIELQPTHFVAHYNRGLLRSFVGDLNRAIQDFDYIIQVEPNNTLAIYNRAQLREQVGNYKGAIADYTRLIKSYPNFMYGYLQRASLRRKTGDVRGALNDETVVARRNLDISFGRARRRSTNKVRMRSDHELDKYQQLVQEDPDTVRNLFGTLYGKVQNEKVTDEFMHPYAPMFHYVYVHGYHATAFFEEMNRYRHANTTTRVFGLSAEAEQNQVQNAESDSRQLQRVEKQCSPLERTLLSAAIALAKYDYTSALNEANCAVKTDTSSVVALMMRSQVAMRSATSSSVTDQQRKAHYSLALSDLHQTIRLAPRNAYLHYNLGCLWAQQHNFTEALKAFDNALLLDARLPEAYYNRALIYKRQGAKDKANADFSKAGQLGLYKAYAMLKNNQ